MNNTEEVSFPIMLFLKIGKAVVKIPLERKIVR
jgi:hypothetical protein